MDIIIYQLYQYYQLKKFRNIVFHYAPLLPEVTVYRTMPISYKSRFPIFIFMHT